MTTYRVPPVVRARWPRANWPALLLPLLALETFGVTSHASWMSFLALAAALAVTGLVPSAAARIAPYAVAGYGLLGFFLLHSLLKQHTGGNPVLLSSSGTAWYGLAGVVSDGASMLLVLPQAFAFLAAGLWLMAARDLPGGAAVRLAVRQLRGTGGQPRTVPPLLLIPVLGLWEEAASGALWFGSPALVAFAVLLGLIAVRTVRRQPRIAAVTAVLGLTAFGPFIAYAALKWADPQPGLLAASYGIVLLDGPAGRLPLILEGLVFLGCGLVLTPRLLTLGVDAELARKAQALAQRVDRLTATRTDATDTAVAELRRVERDLHDGAQARLVAVGMSLRAAEQLMAANPEAALALVAEARDTSSRALADLRDLVRGIYPPVLADRGLADAVRALALDAVLPVDVRIDLPGEPPMPVAAAAYFAVAEALTNVVRHSGARTAQIEVGHAGGMLRATVTDDGHGGADPSRGTGLAGVERRLATFDGILAISSPAGGPTVTAIEIPCALSPAPRPMS